MTRRVRTRADVSQARGDKIAPRQACPCASGRRYKNCHGGGGDVSSIRPFEGFASECDLIALRELVPSATVDLQLVDPALADRSITLATVLPLALPAIVREDGRILIGLQVHARSADVSRDIAAVLESALVAPSGATLSHVPAASLGRRLQDLIDPQEILDVKVHADFGFWVDKDSKPRPEVQSALERANTAVTPTRRLAGVSAAYWSDDGDKAYLRWVLPHDESQLLDAFARLSADGVLTLGEGEKSRYVGSFRAHGCVIPVWEVATDSPGEFWEGPAAKFEQRLADACAVSMPLTSAQRRIREGLRSRQITLR